MNRRRMAEVEPIHPPTPVKPVPGRRERPDDERHRGGDRGRRKTGDHEGARPDGSLVDDYA